MNQVKPLRSGNKIGITAPAGPVSKERLDQAVHAVKKLGFEVELGLTCFENIGGYLAGTARMRAQEINSMFANPSISAIFCLRGGYGTLQLLPLLNYNLIRKNPKWFVGYSDITTLHIVLQQICHLITIHGPMPASDLITADDFTIKSLMTLLQNDPAYTMANPSDEEIKCLVPGYVEGKLTGGNLSVITSTLGTPFEIDTKEKILFLEEVSEPLYKIDRMLTQLALAGKFSDAAGIVLGTWNHCQAGDDSLGLTVEQLIEQMIVPFGKPTILNIRAGHCMPMISLPFGATVYIDASERKCRLNQRL
ncbi:LD-carboxypeptidase [Bacillus sp. FJAT-50079]|uniref:S66 peptidase family protein n=1 Tax=Bacillus sp. FJAT-50079 TaxID=2833577 RepID=UPI001BC99844|nr:LD-carboxypeptidase [Bacillus sp. FJAT-50079]MBS4206908.1 LD-carboxypeptidase [Bacillus sp. FJAT-50079]